MLMSSLSFKFYIWVIKKYKSQKIKKKRNYLITYCVLPKKYCVREMFYDVNFVFIVSIYLT